jgi:hypothetical protein
MNTPAEIVISFVKAHFAWNVSANELSKALTPGSSADEAAMEVAKAEYDDLISRFCANSVNRQGIAFGDDPTHHPDRETIKSVSVSDQRAIVRTRSISPNGLASNYEYHLVRESGEWRIASLLYVDRDGRHECL